MSQAVSPLGAGVDWINFCASLNPVRPRTTSQDTFTQFCVTLGKSFLLWVSAFSSLKWEGWHLCVPPALQPANFFCKGPNSKYVRHFRHRVLSPQLLKNVKTILSSSTVQNKQQDPIGDKLLQIYTRSLIKDLSGSNYVRTRNWK